MAYVPRISREGCDTAGTTANRPTNAAHGQMYYDETIEQLLVWDAVNGGYWKQTVSLTRIYPA